MNRHNDDGHIIFAPSVQRFRDQVVAGFLGIAACAGEDRRDSCILQHFRQSVAAQEDEVVSGYRGRGQFRFHAGTHSQPFGQDVTLRMYERRGGIDQATLHKRLDEGVISRQLCELVCAMEIGAAIPKVGDMGNRRRRRYYCQHDESCAHPF